jgi:4-amino-4-deoxy-L-arabinose transferase-like glycosyltransferase
MPTRRSLWPILSLALLCAALYLPGIATLPPVDRDEARYAQAARQMVATRDWIVPRLQDELRLRKPIGAYWFQAAAVSVGGTSMGMTAHRLPSVLGALLAATGTFAIGRRWFANRAAWLGAALLASSALLVVEAHLATTDALLLASIVAMQGCLASLYTTARVGRRGRGLVAAGFWIALAAGMLIKGPVAPLVTATTIATLAIADRARPRRSLLLALRPHWGVPLLAIGLAPWLLAVANDVGWRALPDAMLADLTPKIFGAHESHGAPPGTYLFMLPVTFWPGSLALLFAASASRQRRRRTAERFLLAWLIPAWLLFEFVPTKLPHYVLPTFPALALLIARAALAAPNRLRPPADHPLTRILAGGWALLTILIGIAVLSAALWLGGRTARAGGLACAAVSTLVALACLRRLRSGQVGYAATVALLAAPIVYGLAFAVVLPHLAALWPSRGAAVMIDRAGGARPLVAAGYHEASLRLLVGRDIARLDGAGSANFLASNRDALVLLGDTERPAFFAAARRLGLDLRSRDAIRAFDYSHGRWIDLDLLERAPTANATAGAR